MSELHNTQVTHDVPIACSLDGEDRQRRGAEIAHLFREGLLEVRRLPDGYALRFPGQPTWAAWLLAFILGERACCPFFTFELIFQPEQGPIWLHLRGPDGAADYVADLLVRVEEPASDHEGQMTT